ncbi:LacI family DNA-binding transcriptional regulator [Clostridium uliginosum]|uniref:LacI family transcriptional regulator n=1 Tax=Clostridium uliginosum TaxID=119641 RepID=A0A1I1Q5F9_9CLOT|nr:LacI family DNA-binding transcriptional regulator [Clostridium uliginosum]SFD17255.1 LacI family transcriptional regulator [Clostridium uliginosum]
MIKKVTIKNLAEAANVSIGTVDRALNDRIGISKKTKAKILDKAKELGYEVNRVAQSLSRRPLRIGCILPGNSNYFYPQVEAGIIEAKNFLIDYNVSISCKKTENLNFQQEIQYINEFIEEGIDGLAICPGHRTKMNSVINKVVDSGIPVVTFSSDAPESKRTTCVGTDSFNNGQIVGDLMTNFIDHKGKIAIITGCSSMTDQQEKVKGFMEVINSYPNSIELIGVYETLEDPKIIYDKVKKIVENTPNLKGIFFTAANSIYGCKALIDLGMQYKVKVITPDLCAEQIPYIENGIIRAIIHQHPYSQGYKAIKILYDILTTNKSYGPNDYIKPDIILKHNLKYFIK